MSLDNVELARRGYAAWLEGGVEAILPFLDPDVEWAQDPRFPGAKTYFGHEGVREWDVRLDETFEERRVELERLVDCGDRVLALLRVYVRGRASGAETPAPMAHLWTIKNGKVIHVQFYLNPAEAFEAAGLRQ